ncbi:mechanosensitive ion channel domain-containing protein [Leptothoe kymatousa]|uniref:Mechanosensitive ion channel n=1 Tax=Leptothoe kymatousa TAU-MAC 1615 TaxID=2364775 RepID=A0ABS5Y403_9CYAN|nr:mechanosensitive ion channel domain-containing protein [Leptothoe kymatousa]MBT9312346.1 mechanosensitive ion channel [Leptothoe kymatousa TAU-MAC 1615]
MGHCKNSHSASGVTKTKWMPGWHTIQPPERWTGMHPWKTHMAKAVLVVFLCWGVFLGLPAYAQTDATAERANVIIDGRVLFTLGRIDTVSADVRANVANQALRQVLANANNQTPPQSIRVITRSRNDLVTVRANRRHVLTVTRGDLMAGIDATERAEEWAGQLQTALDRAQRERQPMYRRQMAWTSAGVFAIATLCWAVFHNLRRWLWRRQNRTGQKLPLWISPALLCAPILAWLAAAIYICELFPRARATRYRVFQFLARIFTNPLFNDGDGQGYSLLNLFQLVLLTLALWMGVRVITSTVKSKFLQATIPDRGTQDAIATILQVLLTGLGVFIILQVLGIDLSALAILASVLGVGLGFGLQNIANNVVSGGVMLFERSIQVGDFINVGDLAGTVERIGMRSTEIRTLDRVAIIVPNAQLLENKVINWSHGHPVSQLHLPIGVAYNSNIPQVHQAVLEVATAHPNVLQYPQPRLRFLGFGDSSLDFDFLVWMRDPRQQFDLKSDLYYMLYAHFRRYNIEIPFPQQDVNLRSPQLDLENWAQPSPERPKTPANPPQQTTPQKLLAEVNPYSSLLQNRQPIETLLLERLVTQMRSDGGIDIQDRRFRLTVYANCFIGSEAVTWLTRTQNATREAAVRLGQALIEQGICHHVTDEHPFKDEYLFYRFYEDEQ